MGTAHLQADDAAAAFGRRIFKILFDAFCEGAFEIEINNLITKEARECGLVEPVAYDPDIHVVDIDWIEPGEEIFYITDIGRNIRDG